MRFPASGWQQSSTTGADNTCAQTANCRMTNIAETLRVGGVNLRVESCERHAGGAKHQGVPVDIRGDFRRSQMRAMFVNGQIDLLKLQFIDGSQCPIEWIFSEA